MANQSLTTSPDNLVTTGGSLTRRVSTFPKSLPMMANLWQGYMTFLILTSFTGVVGNTFVIFAVVTHKKLRVIQNVFIVNLAVADLLVSAIVVPFGVAGIVDNGELFVEHLPGLCEFIATLTVTGCTCSISSIASVSLNRYVAICHRLTYPKIYSKRTVPFMVAGLWVYSFLVDLPNYLGWNEHIFDWRTYTCIYDYTYNLYYTRYFLAFFGFGLPLCILCFSYFSVYCKVFKSTRRMRRHADDTLSKQRFSGIDSADKRLLKTLAVICITFLSMWGPYVVTVQLDQGHRFWIFVPAISLTFLNSSVNFMIYATNETFREAYVRIIKSIICYN